MRPHDYRRLRQRAALTRQQAATRVGLTKERIRQIEAGTLVPDDATHARLVAAYHARCDERRRATGLTAREADVAVRLWRGLSNQEIALELGISPETVAHTLAALYARLGVQGSGNPRVLAARIVYEAAAALAGEA